MENNSPFQKVYDPLNKYTETNYNKLNDGKYVKLGTNNIAENKAKVIEAYVNNCLAERQNLRKIQKDVFFKWKVKISFQDAAQAESPLKVVKK